MWQEEQKMTLHDFNKLVETNHKEFLRRDKQIRTIITKYISKCFFMKSPEQLKLVEDGIKEGQRYVFQTLGVPESLLNK